MNKLSELEEIFDGYLVEHDVYEAINKSFLEKDKIFELFDEIRTSNRIFEEVSVDEIYKICSEGETRYYKQIPPGFEDGKTKDGVQKYNDLIIWKEILKYCKNNGKNAIFITDDIKKDWWNIEGDKREFHKSLIEEFSEFTQQEVLPLISQDLYEILGELYNVSTPDTIQSVLVYNLDNYISNLLDNGDLIEDIQSLVVNSGGRYIDIDSLSNYDGSYFELNYEFDKIDLVSCSMEEYYDDVAIYSSIFDIAATATSRSYIGRDEDSKEIILSDNYYTHVLNGQVSVKITRTIENNLGEFIDNILEDYEYSSIEVIYGDLKEIEGFDSSDLCVQCHRNIGITPYGDEGDMVCSECAVQDDHGDICPSCGKKKPFRDMAGNGFCKECTDNSDFL